VAQPSVEQWLQDFDGGRCFYIRAVSATPGSASVEGFGNDRTTFERLEGDFLNTFKFDPSIKARMITAQQCPAVAMAALARGSGGARPLIDLESEQIPPGGAIAGRLRNAEGRTVNLLLVSDDGQVQSLDRFLARNKASFSAPTKDASQPRGASHLLMAIVSDAPLSSLSGLRSGGAQDVFERLREELGKGAAAQMDVVKIRLGK
jgi:serine/threonine-protein kinase